MSPRLAPLVDGATEHHVPPCWARLVADRPTAAVVRLVKEALTGVPANALLVTLHIRRGDSAMGRENPAHVDMEQEDTKGGDRIRQSSLEERLQCTADHLALLRKRASPRPVGIFIASDTVGGLDTASKFFPDFATIDSALSVHTSRVAGKPASVGVKVVADFWGLSLGDLVVGLGSSTFGAMAAAAGLAPVKRVGDDTACVALSEEEIELILKQQQQQ